jgi:hypothetical protein
MNCVQEDYLNIYDPYNVIRFTEPFLSRSTKESGFPKNIEKETNKEKETQNLKLLMAPLS